MLQKGFDLILVSSIGEAKRRIFEDKEIELVLCDLELPDGTAKGPDFSQAALCLCRRYQRRSAAGCYATKGL